MNAPLFVDRNEHLRAIYRHVLSRQDRFDEFKQLLSMYPRTDGDADAETEEAVQIRELLNDRIAKWTGTPFAHLSATEMHAWRGMLVDHRINIAVSPWKEANSY